MLGCMVESGLGIAAGAQIASLFDHVDLDGNLLIAHDPWPGVQLVDGVQLPPTAGARCPNGYLILAEGFSGDPHYGKTMRGVLRYRREDVVAVLDSARARARPRTASRSSRSVDEALSFGRTPRSSAWPRREDASRRRGRAARGAASRRASTSRTASTCSSPTIPSCATSPPGTASSCATCAGRPPTSRPPTGANLDVAGDDRAHGRVGLRNREDDRLARARSRGAPPRHPRSVFVPTGQTGIAIAGWGIAVDAVVADFIAGAAERLVVEGAERGGELLWVEGQGVDPPPGLLGRDARPRPRQRAAPASCCATRRAARPSRAPAAVRIRSRRLPSSSS